MDIPSSPRVNPQTQRQSSLEPVGSVLQRLQPQLIVSKQRIRQVERMELVRIKRIESNQSLCFSSRPFVLCGLPARKLPQAILFTNGAMGSSYFK